MKDIFASLALWAGGGAGFLTILDWVLSDRQKKWISDCAISLFVWLDDQRELKYLRHLGKFKWQIVVTILYAVVALSMLGLVSYGMYTGGFEASEVEAPGGLIHVLLGGYLGSFLAALLTIFILHPYVLNWVTKTEGSWAYIRRSTLALLATLLVTIGVLAVYGTVDYLVYGTAPAPDFKDLLAQRNVYYLLFANTINGFALTVALLMLMSWLLLVIPVVFILLLMSLFRVVEAIAARIAESPKGPVLALSAILTIIGAAFKNWG